MAEDNMIGYVTGFLLIGIVILGSITFFINLTYNEGREDIFDGYPEVENLRQNFSNVYSDGQLIETTNINSNLSSDYNPELALSGADQSGNAIQTNLQNIATSLLVLSKFFLFLLFGNVVGQIIFGLIVTIAGGWATYYFIKQIRTGT